MSNREIAILPLENYDLSPIRDSLEVAALMYGLEPRFALDAYITSDISDVERKRKQRDAARVIISAKNILKDTDENPRYALIVTNQDVYTSKLNFVFGLANHDLGVGLVSTTRLTQRDEEVTPSQIKERIMKEAAHEIGHLGGLVHCEKEGCLMAFSDTIEMVDQKLPMLCGDCKRKLRTDGR